MSIRFHFTEILQGFVVRARCRLNSSLLGAAIVAHPGWTIQKRPDGPALASRSTFLRNLDINALGLDSKPIYTLSLWGLRL